MTEGYPTFPDDIGFMPLGDVTMEGEYYKGDGDEDRMRVIIRRGERTWEVHYTFEYIDGTRYITQVEAPSDMKVDIQDGNIKLSLNVGEDDDD